MTACPSSIMLIDAVYNLLSIQYTMNINFFGNYMLLSNKIFRARAILSGVRRTLNIYR